jgi:hypothetical protein
MVTLVLGNGFDKCLGWKTGYSDFLNSSFFPKNNKWKKSGMYNAIVNDAIAKEDSWGGIEESLERYAMLPETAHTFEEDLEFYNCLCFSFRLYLGSEVLREGEGANLEYRISARDSCSVDFIMEPLFFDSAINNVISFNYTDFGRIAKGVIKEYDGTDANVRRIQRIIDSIDFRYLHRREDGRMVLGISSDAVLQDYRYDYYKKSHIAIPVSFYDILLDSQTLIFWGFSFSKCDQPYFNDFFRHISKPEEGKNKRTIFLVDYDDASHKKCLSRIETMLGGDLSSLCCKHEVIEVNTNRGVSSREFANMLLYLRAKISPF